MSSNLGILAAEKNLLLAVRDRLRSQLKLKDEQCDVELDEMAPATVGDTYYAVMPGGVIPGPYHLSSGGVYDLTYGVDVCVAVRASKVPRDRTRDIFVGNLGALANLLDRVIIEIDFRYEVTDLALVRLKDETGSSQGWHHPLVLSGMDAKPTVVPAEFFGAANDPRSGIKRTLQFRQAARKVVR